MASRWWNVYEFDTCYESILLMALLVDILIANMDSMTNLKISNIKFFT
jgi:hypothetical protein